MPESPRVELVFEYVCTVEGVYRGTASVMRDAYKRVAGDPTPEPEPEPLSVRDVSRADWVAFVWNAIRLTQATDVAFVFPRSDGTTHRHKMGRWTIDRIKSGDLTLEDVLL